jgi:hypothetical protein
MNTNPANAKPLESIAEPEEPIHEWFGLSHADYLVIPRTILQSCTIENQKNLVTALDAIYEECSENMEHHWPHEAEIHVRLKCCETRQYIHDSLANYERGRRRLWPQSTPERIKEVEGCYHYKNKAVSNFTVTVLNRGMIDHVGFFYLEFSDGFTHTFYTRHFEKRYFVSIIKRINRNYQWHGGQDSLDALVAKLDHQWAKQNKA